MDFQRLALDEDRGKVLEPLGRLCEHNPGRMLAVAGFRRRLNRGVFGRPQPGELRAVIEVQQHAGRRGSGIAMGCAERDEKAGDEAGNAAPPTIFPNVGEHTIQTSVHQAAN